MTSKARRGFTPRRAAGGSGGHCEQRSAEGASSAAAPPSETFRLGPALLALAAFHVAFFLPLYTTDGVPFLRDVSLVQVPVKTIALAQMRQGSLPLWLPSLSGGQPLLGNPNYFLFHPGNLLPLALGVPRGLKAFLLLQYALAAAGALLLGRRLGLSLPASLLFGTAFAHGGFLLAMGNLLNSLATAALLPWLLLAADRLVAGERGGVAGMVVVGALQVFSGEPTPALLSFLLALGFAGARAARPGRAVAVGALCLALAALVAGPQLVPAALFLSQSDRAGGLTAPEVLKWSLPPVRLLELVFPRLLGRADFAVPPRYLGGGFEDGGYPYVNSVYVGPVVLLLAAVGAATSRGGRLLVILAAVAAGASLGRHLPGAAALVELVPGAAILRYPSKLHLVVSVALGLAAAMGLDRLGRRGAAAAAGAAGLLGALAAAVALPGFVATLAGRAASSPEVKDAAVAGLVVPAFATVGVALVAALALLASAREVLAESAARWLLLGAHGAASLAFLPALVPLAPPAFYATEPPPVAALRERLASAPAGPWRVYWERPEGGLRLPAEARVGDVVAARGSSLALAFGQRMLGQEHVGRLSGLEYAFETGWEGGTLGSIRRRAEAFAAAAWPDKRRMLDEDGVRFVLSFASHPDLSLVRSFPDLEARPLYLYENPAARPRVEGPPGTELLAAGPAHVRIRAVAAGAVRVAVNAYPLWRAATGEEPVAVAAESSGAELRLDAPHAGDVDLWLDPWDLRLGLVLSAVGVGGMLLLRRAVEALPR